MRNWRDFFQQATPNNPEVACEELAQHIVGEGMGSAAIVFLESIKPLGFIAGQSAIFATPMLGGFIDPMKMEQYADLLGDRAFVERLISRIEELEMARGDEKPK